MNLITYFFLLLLLSACGAGDGSSLDENGRPLAVNDEQPMTPTEDNEEIQASLVSLQQQVFTPICSVCHIGANAPFGLELDTLEHSANNLINVSAESNAEFKRVEPGSKELSFLYLKVIGDPRAGSRMPLNQAPLSESAIAAIGQWIDDGANIDINQAPLFVKQISHISNNTTLVLTIEFSVDVDPDSLLAEEILVTTNTQVFPPPEGIIWQSPRILTLMINKPADTKQMVITFNQAAISTITGIFGQRLDGDRDGWPGGELSYVATF
ncbi:hypothetical protein tinsulaeT_16840 [Thalassotalea insulae]|uniref:Cytochrome c domain-containing protein n=1 Tax=Thalassotalea insulae TaxID=2056778 RepID=A0ABQ6GRU0_9GAMM|nr:hypothetical protein [Thalassotalea insulae]GLX78344.1 hypothetical protein tinsulaeT_16840 [Thalassotalea insulae]